jgi:hypothetical protein
MPRHKISVLQDIHVYLTETNEEICYPRRKKKVATLEESLVFLGFKLPKTPLE